MSENSGDTRIISSVADASSDGMRLDLWLSFRFTYHSRSRWQALIRDAKILLNGRKSRCSAVLRTGDRVSFVPDIEEPEVSGDFSIEYEDDYFMLVNKPGRLPCHPAGPFFRNTLWHMLSDGGNRKISIVNRLDRETSGLLIAAKSSRAASLFSRLFNEDAIEKKYTAIVHGEFPPSLDAEGFMLPDTESPVRKKRRFLFGDASPGGGEKAITLFTGTGFGNGLSVVEAFPKTGRLHQIRATLFSLGFPLAGDKLYGLDDTLFLRFSENRLTSDDLRTLMVSRQALHAASLSFTHPFTGESFCREIPLPDDLSALYSKACGV